jgi:hypothetical protein
LKSELDEISAHFQLLINMLFNISMREKLKYFLFVLLNFVNNRDKEEKGEKDRTRGSNQDIQENLHVLLAIVF